MNNRNETLVLSTAAIIAFSILVGGLYMASAESTDEDEIDLDLPFSGPFGFRKHGGMLGFLDEEQRNELREALEALRDEDASFEEIRDYILGYLKEHGVESLRPESMKPELTEEQLEAYEQLRSDVKEYTEKRAEELGIELPPNGGFLFPRMGMRARWGAGCYMPKMGEG